MSPKCSCGTLLPDNSSRWEKATHTRRHNQWAEGMSLPPTMPDPGDLLIVPGDGPVRLRMLAYRTARIVQRAAGHLYVSFPYPQRRTPDWEQWRQPLAL